MRSAPSPVAQLHTVTPATPRARRSSPLCVTAHCAMAAECKQAAASGLFCDDRVTRHPPASAPCTWAWCPTPHGVPGIHDRAVAALRHVHCLARASPIGRGGVRMKRGRVTPSSDCDLSRKGIQRMGTEPKQYSSANAQAHLALCGAQPVTRSPAQTDTLQNPSPPSPVGSGYV